jgi:hypothetical protein
MLTARLLHAGRRLPDDVFEGYPDVHWRIGLR